MNIFRAAEEGDEAEVSRLLDADPGLLEMEAIDGSKPLAVAAIYGQLGVVRLLVERGANINASGRHFMALHYAALRGFAEMADFLMGNGANAATPNSLGSTPLMLASSSGHVGVVHVLVKHTGQALLEDIGESGSTALHWAAIGNRQEVVRALLLAGADPGVRDSRRRTPRAVAKRDARSPGCVAVFDWWKGELERRYLVQRARCIQDVYTTHRAKPAAPVPAFLQARMEAKDALPQVEVVVGQQDEEQAGASGKMKASTEENSMHQEEERHEVLAHVVTQLNEQLFTELMQGFHTQGSDGGEVEGEASEEEDDDDEEEGYDESSGSEYESEYESDDEEDGEWEGQDDGGAGP